MLALSILLSNRNERSRAWVRHTLEVENGLSELDRLLYAAESGARGYVLTGDPAFRAPYDRAAREAPQALNRLGVLTADNPAQVAVIGRLRQLVAARLNALELNVQGRSAGRTQSVMGAIATGGGQRMMAQIVAETDRMRQTERRLLAVRTAEAAQLSRLLRIALVLLFGLFCAFAAWILHDARSRIRKLGAARAALESANAGLRQAMDAQAAAEARVRQMQKMEAIGQLTGGIAHDFNNMLSVIMGSIDLAQRRLAGDQPKVAALLANALDGAGRAATLVARLLAFARRAPLAPGAVDLNRLVGGLSDMLRRTLGERIALETVLGGGLWSCFADAGEIENAVLNLAVNARDAMPDGGKLTIETANAHLDDAYAAEVPELAPGQYVLLSVTDTGEGMSRDVVERAFDPFFTTKDVGRGTGLGLSQVYGFVRQSGGHAKIYSEPGHGTSVHLYLPRHADGAAVGPTAAGPPVAQPGHETILVVEDNADLRRVAVAQLQSFGYVVHEAASAAEALTMMERLPTIDLLFTDVMMPGGDGRALAREAVRRRPRLKVLLTTGFAAEAAAAIAGDHGFALINKPYRAVELAAELRRLLGEE